MKTNCTGSRIVILKELFSGPKLWSELARVYYGPERYKNKARTSFNNQLRKLDQLGFIAKVNGAYAITYSGGTFFESINPELVANIRSEARRRHDNG